MKAVTVPALLALGVLALAGTAFAQGMGPGMMGAQQETVQASAGVQSVLDEIYQSQNTDAQQGIDCASVSDDQFERLGDAYMETIHPGQEHEYMDRMMGGEGSESLRQAHIAMGNAYLDCGSGYGDTRTMPMMYGNGMGGGYGMYYGGPMMGGFGFGYGWLGTLTDVVWLIAGVLLIVVLSRKLNKPTHHE